MSKRIVLVTGASRGLGQGIATALGVEDTIVYLTGRSVDRPTGEWPGTLHETAERIERNGGKAVIVPCDHLDDAQTKAVFERIDADEGQLDILVNNAFAMPGYAAAAGNFWERPLDLWTGMVDVGLRGSYVASHYGAPLMVRRGRGLIVNTSGPGAKVYRHPLPYGVGKAGNDKLAHDMAHELRPFGVAAIALWAGLIGTERTLSAIAHTPAEFAPAGGKAAIESPTFAGYVIDAIYASPGLMKLSGGTFYTTELAEKFGVTEADGTRPATRRPLFGAPLYDPIEQ